ncbi:hypothetical protein QA646_25055 (plasmid) [Rhizobium sp. CB3090]|uniref:hypothetical protein n=1 Tax=Rhizobium sp. CB3090 TaxID=3039156 RepID=UPI0024B166B5|nr:hypothetical protein [Rhizobium sp. CB3090]WFU11657.1 hypothetical protein QA646_25055 [Rhizobium sp. CB3090]
MSYDIFIFLDFIYDFSAGPVIAEFQGVADMSKCRASSSTTSSGTTPARRR